MELKKDYLEKVIFLMIYDAICAWIVLFKMTYNYFRLNLRWNACIVMEDFAIQFDDGVRWYLNAKDIYTRKELYVVTSQIPSLYFDYQEWPPEQPRWLLIKWMTL